VEIRQHGLEYRGEWWGFAAWENFLVGTNTLRWGGLGKELGKWEGDPKERAAWVPTE